MGTVLTWLLTLLTVGYLVYRIRSIIRLILLGRADNRFDQPRRRLGNMLQQSILQLAHFRSNVADYRLAGVAHLAVFFGFLVLLPGEGEFLLAGLFPGFDFSFLPRPLFGLYLFSQDVFVPLVILAVLVLLFRRLVLRPKQISHHFTAYLILFWILVLMVTLLLISAFRLDHHPEFVSFLPVATLFAAWTGIDGFDPIGYGLAYWIHLAALLSFVVFVLNSKHAHVFTAIPANYFRHIGPSYVALSPVDFEDESVEHLGVGRVEAFSWKRIFDGFACTECGRCEDRCPANRTGKPLSPKEIVLSIKRNAIVNAPVLLGRDPSEPVEERPQALIDEVCIGEAALWSCTTCGACTHVCPVGNEHLSDILEMRRHLVMDQGSAPEIMSRALKSLETRGHPFYGTACGPDDWKEDLAVPLFEVGKTEYLLWLGCAVVYEERAQKIARAMVQILDEVGISYGILEDFRCTGDPAKQIGNEFLFQEIAMQNIGDFSELGIRQIITLCPHCFNAFHHHYRELGADLTVTPHPLFLAQLLETGRIHLTPNDTTICYHDPCYLARHNGFTEEPRALIAAAGKGIEMHNSGQNGFCCGAGGGNYWAEESGERINRRRAEEAYQTRADVVATACPFCLLMLTDGMKNLTENGLIQDIAEIIAARLIR
jgi:Fe-S oxidoreductase